MQSAKDSFFSAMRERLAAINPDRIVIIDGQTRPGVLVCENEAVGADELVTGVFCITFGKMKETSTAQHSPMSISCGIAYKSSAVELSGELGRGRALAEMDVELRTMLAEGSIPKFDYSGAVPTPLATNVFWGLPTWGAIASDGEEVRREVEVEIFFYPEMQS